MKYLILALLIALCNDSRLYRWELAAVLFMLLPVVIVVEGARK